MRAESDPDPRLTHDLLNALAVVKGYAQLLQRQVRRGEPADVILPRLARIDEQADAATTLVDALRRRGPRDQDGAGSATDGRDGRE